MGWILMLFTIVSILLYVCPDDTAASLKACKSKTFGAVKDGFILNDGLIQNTSTSSEAECVTLCLKNMNCVSYNFGTGSDGRQVCQLGSKDVYTSQANLQRNEKFLHRAIATGCDSGPCGTHQTCIPNHVTGGHNCSCKPEHVHHRNKQCYKEVPLGSNKAKPGKSCKDIVDQKAQDIDGDYWIQPKPSDQPFLVYCDMTTDNGGWTLLTQIVYPAGNKVTLTDSIYNSMQKYSLGNISPNLNAMKTVQSTFSVEQLRFNCYKKSPGNTIDIATTKDDKGKAVVEYFTGVTNTRPPSCGNFNKLPKDTARLTSMCGNWYKSTWSSDLNYDVDQNRLFDHTFFTYGQYHFLVATADRQNCDDFSGSQAGDFWRVYIR